jgi:hypothetical protein
MAATLTVSRDMSFGIELRRGTFQVRVDGTSVGSIENHGVLEVALDPGHHTIRMQAGRYSSQEHPLDVTDGEVVSFRCYGARIWPRYVASIVKPDLAITLKRVG